ncbi:HotDog domain-containing protein [Pseudoneurospora amorphoporcata]|uniref:HotDog domain-containing protein n=1 Tax=Pseudoneurospora amorphoporcata TaxID=241081 RepID=A0AAN6SG87_9PEZI|nr:HotDog domain-containing protein [Pseudoneurospora amorphoporcata]
MSGPGVGFEYPTKSVSWCKRDLLLFAQSIGCKAEELHFLYELHPNFTPFPTYSLALSFKLDSSDVVDFYAAQKSVAIPGVPVFDPTRVVDGQRRIEFFKQLPTSSEGKKFESRTKVVGVYDKGRPGSVVETQTDIVDAASNEVYSRIHTSSFYVNQGNWGGPKGPATQNFPPPKDKKPDAVFENQTTPETPLLYRLNGDYNPLHADPEPGKKMGFGGVIIHGLYSWNWACHGLLQHLGGSDPANIKEYQARFASPVRGGDKLVASAWKTGQIKDGWEEIRFQVQIEDGKVVLSNGRALMKCVGPAPQNKLRSYDGALCTSATAASFIRPTRPADAPQTFLSAIQLKYASDGPSDNGPVLPGKQIIVGGKVAEEVGFDKIRRKQAQLSELKIVILDGSCIVSASSPTTDQDQTIRQTSPKVVELDISRNLFIDFGTVVDICSELDSLHSLRVNGNRFQNVLEDNKLNGPHEAFKGVKELEMGETLLTWPEICHVASNFPSLTLLEIGTNQLSTLAPIPPAFSFTSTLVSLNLEFNEFTSLEDIAALTSISTLRNLHLKGNLISTITSSPSKEVSDWQFVDALLDSLPGLTSIRFSHNPIYENPGLEDGAVPETDGTKKGTAASDEAFMLMAARLPSVRTLNFSNITTADRTNAEMYYLSRIARQLSSTPEAEEAQVLARHRRWAELCELYGEPVVSRQQDINPNFLEARLITVHLYLAELATSESEDNTAFVGDRIVQIPKSFDIYAVKGIAGRLFGLLPLKLRLVWETGEWDPVGGFDDDDGDSSEDEEIEARRERKQDDAATSIAGTSIAGKKGGRFVRREVELKDGPRQFGYCVDGLEAKIRVELR